MHHFLTYKLGSLVGILVLYTAPSLAQPDAPDGLNSEALRTWLKAEWYDPYFDDLGYNGARTDVRLHG